MTSRIAELLEELKTSTSPGITILTDQHDAQFQEYAERWTDIGRKTPAAIVLPLSEEQIQATVRWAVSSSVPFVTKSGGHSEWSTIDESGIIIDLSKYASIDIDAEQQRATLRGSVLSKQVGVALAEAGFFTALGNGNPVGAIPYFLGGGASVVTSDVGYGSDQIVSARLIDATGKIVEVNEEKTPALLWAIRGAGQFFGLITELVVKVYPLAALGNDNGLVWTGIFVFPLERADEVASVMADLVNDSDHATAGLFMIGAPPPKHQPAVMVAARYTGDPAEAKVAYKALYDLQPLVAHGAPVPIQNISDGREAFNAHGGFKRFGTVGLRRFDKAGFLQVVDLWKDMVATCPDAKTTSFNFQWDARPPRPAPFDSANSLHDTRFWQNNFIWHTDVASREKVDEYSLKAIAAMREATYSEQIEFGNATRAGPVELRFRGNDRADKLKALKQVWDPSGVFTRQLLD